MRRFICFEKLETGNENVNNDDYDAGENYDSLDEDAANKDN